MRDCTSRYRRENIMYSPETGKHERQRAWHILAFGVEGGSKAQMHTSRYLWAGSMGKRHFVEWNV